MKKTILILILFGFSVLAKSQNVSVEHSSFGIQTGFLGIWVHNESRLSNKIALRSELGLDAGIFSKRNNDLGVFLAPVLTLEPRWYYNLTKRQKKSKRIDGNSGNFIAIKTSYHPDWFIVFNEKNIDVINDISIIPTWGIKRNLGRYFNYEIGIGIGFVHFFSNNNSLGASKQNFLSINLHLRLGYRF